MARPYDWSPVDLAADPVPGDATVIDSVALAWSELAYDADWARGRISALLADDAVVAWIGKAGDAFRSHSSKLPDQLVKAAESYRQASTALAVWSTDLDADQRQHDRRKLHWDFRDHRWLRTPKPALSGVCRFSLETLWRSLVNILRARPARAL